MVTGGGGGDGDDVYRLGIDVTMARPQLRTVLVAGPYADSTLADRLAEDTEPGHRVRVLRNMSDCAALMTRAGAVIQMAGYNSTLEALAAGIRPILVPRRAPRREQAIRAIRLAAMGVADVVDGEVSPGELAWLLGRPRVLPPGALEAAGIRLDGAERAAGAIRELSRDRPRPRRLRSRTDVGLARRDPSLHQTLGELGELEQGEEPPPPAPVDRLSGAGGVRRQVGVPGVLGLLHRTARAPVASPRTSPRPRTADRRSGCRRSR